MGNGPRLEEKVRKKIERWFALKGEDFIVCTKEFCQGNRMSLRPLMELVVDLAVFVFVNGGAELRDDLLEDLEYGIFDLIGRFSSTPGGECLFANIQENIIQHVTKIFVEAKRRWNLNNYKITESIEAVHPCNGIKRVLKPSRDNGEDESLKTERQAKELLETMAIFAQAKFKGEKNKKIAMKMLENPERVKDFSWLADIADTSIGSVKVTLTRVRQTLAKNFAFERLGDKLTITRIKDISK